MDADRKKKAISRSSRGNQVTRRDFLKGTSLAFVGAAFGLSPEKERKKKSRVVLVRHAEVLDENFRIHQDILQEMLDDAVMRLQDRTDPVKAFQDLVKPGEVVGVKTNVWSYLPTPAELEKAIRRRLVDSGIREEDISFDDHGVKENPIFRRATSLINVRPLRTHYLAGISGCMKNFIMFAESQPAYHPNSCSKLGSLFSLPQVKGKVRLHILAALTPQFHGRGPHHFSRRYVWPYKGLLVARDPVAVDAVGLKLIMAKRTLVLGKSQAVPPVPRHIEVADKVYSLGTSDPSRIELIKVGWDEDVLI